ncbi:MAG: hypothetical protein ACI9FJ_002781, partial [Alteromonadaceae bacterium]
MADDRWHLSLSSVMTYTQTRTLATGILKCTLSI